MDIILTFIIPTYNRSYILNEALTSIYNCFAAHLNKIQIAISDNSSVDSTSEVIQNWKAKFPSYYYHKQATLLPAERNFASLIPHSTGKYLWLYGDDEYIPDTPGLADKVFYTLRQDFDLICINHISYPYHSKFQNLEPRFPINIQDVIFLNPSALLISVWRYFSFGTLIGSREVIRTEPSYEKYFPTEHYYSGMIFENLNQISKKRKVKIYCTQDVWVHSRSVSKSYSKRLFEIHYRKIPEWFCLLPDELNFASRKILTSYRREYCSIKKMIEFRLKSELSIKSYYKVHSSFKKYIPMLFIVACIPRAILKLYKKIRTSISSYFRK